MSGMGVTDPTHISFRLAFDEASSNRDIALICETLAEDGWDLYYDEEKRVVTAQKPYLKMGVPTIIQGPPSPKYLAEKVYGKYAAEWDKLNSPPDRSFTWDELPEDEQACWIAAMTGD